MRRAAGLLVLGGGCVEPALPGDCGFHAAESCAWFEPAGLNCGLAHELDEHHGSSCGTHDPALRFRESDVEVGYGPGDTARRTDARCPEGFSAVALLDPDARRDPDAVEGSWWSCVAEGNAAYSSASLRDVPVGAVCGLSRPASSQVVLCEGFNPAQGECPPGYRFRWVMEHSTRDEDETCTPVEGTHTLNPVVGLLVFCEVTPASGGCTDDCPEVGRAPMCGLHVRAGVWDDDPLDTDLLDLEEDPFGNENGPLSPLEYLEFCAPHQAYLSPALLAALQQAAPLNLEPQCRGEDIERQGCPAGYSYQCTSDYSGNEPEERIYGANLCWCAPDSDCQGEPGWCDTRGW